jgi:hypothetical protein
MRTVRKNMKIKNFFIRDKAAKQPLLRFTGNTVNFSQEFIIGCDLSLRNELRFRILVTIQLYKNNYPFLPTGNS